MTRSLSVERYLVLVAVVFIGPFNIDANVIALLLGQLGHHTTKSLHHKRRHLLIQVLWQHFNADSNRLLCRGQVGKALCIQVNLRQNLVSKRAVHDSRWVTRGISKVHQTSLSEK